MLLIWKIRYLDSQDGLSKDRELMLDTDSLDPVTKAAVELAFELRGTRERDFIRFRHRFSERKLSGDEMNELILTRGGINSFCLPRYFEDENGKELTDKQMGFIHSGHPNSITVPAGTPRHYIEYALSGKPPVPLDKISLSQDQLNILGLFAQNLDLMLASTYFRDLQATLSGNAGGPWNLQTAASNEEIDSFVMIFRKLYMEQEPANFLKTANIFGRVLQADPLAKLVTGIKREYAKGLRQPPDFVLVRGSVTFTRGQLINIYLNTQYAHQSREETQGQFVKYLAAVGDKLDVLTWLFFKEISGCALHICNGGRVIADFLEHYCRCHKVSPNILPSIAVKHRGLGKLEKTKDREQRIQMEKAEEVAQYLWEAKGQPPGGPEQFIDEAKRQMKTFRDQDER
jgi:hypothetical protein